MTSFSSVNFSFKIILLGLLISSRILILNVSNPIDEISRNSLSSFTEIIKENVPSVVVVVPIFFLTIPTAANGITSP